jgi:arginyl-tRNA synthetase
MPAMEIWFDPALELDALLRAAAAKTPALAGVPFDPEVRPADPRFGDYQANGVLAAAKAAKANPRALAGALLETLAQMSATDPGFVETSIAGPGFINFKLTPAFLDIWLARHATAGALRKGASALYAGRKVVLDYPSPNTAKQMHVGHLRPIVIGEALARMLAFCGADLVRDNHLGDWGTNFGILIHAIKQSGRDLSSLGDNPLEELETLYKQGSAATKADPARLEAARAELVKLQSGDPENTALWERIVAISNAACQELYALLGVQSDITLGESFYRDKVQRVYDELSAIGLAEENDGALVVWHDEHPRFSRAAQPSQPFIIRKKDGGSNYGSTDLATILYRAEQLRADECIYVTDGRQQDHFQQLFLTARKWFDATGRAASLPVLRHVWFGTILGEDGRAIKTKEGAPVRLRTLLQEAMDRALAIVTGKNPALPQAERELIARSVGIGAVRYADLQQNRNLDYTFSWQRLLAFEGNTAPYLLYALARIRSIFRKTGEWTGQDAPSPLATPAELALARKLADYPRALREAATELRPHHLCTHLFEIASAYGAFNSADKVLTDDGAVRARRLRLCAATAEILDSGLRLLGIEPLERM